MFKQLFLHGSPEDISVNEILIPGSVLGKNSNGGHSDHVYFVSTQGYSLSECEGGECFNNTFEYAVNEALMWSDNKFIYIVEPSANISADLNYDVSPACLKSESASITHKINVQEMTFNQICEAIRAI